MGRFHGGLMLTWREFRDDGLYNELDIGEINRDVCYVVQSGRRLYVELASHREEVLLAAPFFVRNNQFACFSPLGVCYLKRMLARDASKHSRCILPNPPFKINDQRCIQMDCC